jgi:mannose/cellobiose epimerase-like protein (N-acyl-D-glucosamine 2-epimerase family)
MHAVEAYLAAYSATGSSGYLQRAQLIASNLAHRLTPIVQRDTGLPLLYEHYNTDWTAVDLQYNIDKPSDVFRPWGFQPGHLVEWARLLLQLDGLRGVDGAEAESWYVERARQLFDAAMQYGWDEAVGGGGVVYCFSPIAPHAVCDADKYKWVNIESVATAARLAVITGDERYWGWYERLWSWSWSHLIDHTRGAWYRLTDREGRRYDDLKSPPGKVDYHVVGACKDVISVIVANAALNQQR